MKKTMTKAQAKKKGEASREVKRQAAVRFPRSGSDLLQRKNRLGCHREVR